MAGTLHSYVPCRAGSMCLDSSLRFPHVFRPSRPFALLRVLRGERLPQRPGQHKAPAPSPGGGGGAGTGGEGRGGKASSGDYATTLSVSEASATEPSEARPTIL